jgi:hypothetical protein
MDESIRELISFNRTLLQGAKDKLAYLKSLISRFNKENIESREWLDKNRKDIEKMPYTVPFTT